MKKYKWGFSLHGFIIILLILLPNVFYLFMNPPDDVLRRNESSLWFLNLLENVFRAALMFLFITVKSKGKKKEKISAVQILAILFLMLYYTGWICYFTGITDVIVLIGLAVFPVLYFICSALWLSNYMVVVPVILFGIVHLYITSMNFML